MSLALRYLAHSEIGLVRKNNQDSAYTSPTMLVVADGMGGAAAGDLASAIAVRELKEADGTHSGEEMLDVLGDAIDSAGAAISDLIASDPSLDGMGSTVCGVMFDGDRLGLANIGDSRAYRWADGQLTRLTRDHSWVQALVDEGRITEAEALEHPHRSLILKVVNGQPQHTPDLAMVDVQAGDRLLICSDGLCGFVTDDVIAACMDGEREDVMDALVGLAHHEGGQDNITIIIADIVEGEPEGVTEVLGAAADLDLDNPQENTARLALPAGAGPRPDPSAGELARYSPLARRRPSTWVKLVLLVLLPLLAIGGGGWLWYSYTQQQYYLAANGEYLAIFQGIPEPVFSLPLSHVVTTDTTRVADLPLYYQEQVRSTLPAESYQAAEETLATLRLKAEACIQQRQERENPTPTPTPAPSGTAKGTPKPTGSAGPSPSAAPSPSSTPSDTSTPAAPTEC